MYRRATSTDVAEAQQFSALSGGDQGTVPTREALAGGGSTASNPRAPIDSGPIEKAKAHRLPLPLPESWRDQLPLTTRSRRRAVTLSIRQSGRAECSNVWGGRR